MGRKRKSPEPPPPPPPPPSFWSALPQQLSMTALPAALPEVELSTPTAVLTLIVALFVGKRLITGLLRLLGVLKSPLQPGGGRCVLITGCDSGFGKLLTESAVANGFEVVAACYTKEGAHRFEDVAAVTPVVADLTKPKDLARVVEVAKAKAGTKGLFGLVNNAGLCKPGNVEWLPVESYTASMALNFHAPVALTYELLPALKAAKGRVVNVTSVDGFLPLPTNAAYNASKHALEAYSDTLRCEMKPWGVKVVVVEPATMRTPLAMSFADSWLEGFRKADPLRTQAPYGDAWAERTAANTKQGISDLAADPMETVDALLLALRHVSPPTRIATGRAARFLFKPLSKLPDAARDTILYAMSFGGAPPPAGLAPKHPTPPPGVVSHVTIRVRDLARSVEFYKKVGLACVGPVSACGKEQLMKGGRHAKWQPLVLLLEDEKLMKGPRGESSEAGMTRLCIYTDTFKASVARLSSLGLEPFAPPAIAKAGSIAAYKDPDGFVVYLIVFGFPLYPMAWLSRLAYGVKDPQVRCRRRRRVHSSKMNLAAHSLFVSLPSCFVVVVLHAFSSSTGPSTWGTFKRG